MFYRSKDFHVRCGSGSVISRSELIDALHIFSPSAFDDNTFYHHSMIAEVTRKGLATPFPAIVYRTDYGLHDNLEIRYRFKTSIYVWMKNVIRYTAKLLMSRRYSPRHRELYGEPLEAESRFSLLCETPVIR